MGGRARGRTGKAAPPAPVSLGRDKATGLSLPRPLSSGRTLALTPATGTDNERLQVISPAGEVEVEIALTAEGPIVRVRGADLRLSSSRSIDLDSAGPVRIRASELRVRTEKSVHLNGETILLNCDENAPPVAQPRPALPAPSGSGPCCGGNHETDHQS